jgi:hypothetical protein
MDPESSLPYSKSPPLFRILSHMNLVHTLPLCFVNIISILPFHLRLGLSSDLFPSSYLTKILHAFVTSPMRAAYPVHRIILDFITLITFGEEEKLRCSLLCIFLQSSVSSFRLNQFDFLTNITNQDDKTGHKTSIKFCDEDELLKWHIFWKFLIIPFFG